MHRFFVRKVGSIKIIMSGGLFKNIVSLSVLQGINYIAPLITLPFLFKVLGAEKYGLVAFCQAVVLLLGVFVDFGFDLSATREIAIKRSDNKHMSNVFWSVIFTKLIFLAAVFLVLVALAESVDSLHGYSNVLYVCFLSVVGQALFPVWLFQGLEKMVYVTVISLVIKIISVCTLILFINTTDDYLLAALIMSLGGLVTGVIGLVYSIRRFDVRFTFAPLSFALQLLKNSSYFFVSRASSTGGAYIMILLVGASLNLAAAGAFDAAYKLYKAYLGCYGMLAQALYPYMSKNKDLKTYSSFFKFVMLGNVMMLALIYFFSESLLLLVFGGEVVAVFSIFKILIGAAFFGVGSVMLGFPLLAAFGYIKAANFSLLYAFVAHMLFILCVYLFGGGVFMYAASVIVFELAAVSFRVFYVGKYNVMGERPV